MFSLGLVGSQRVTRNSSCPDTSIVMTVGYRYAGAVDVLTVACGLAGCQTVAPQHFFLRQVQRGVPMEPSRLRIPFTESPSNSYQ